MFKDNESSFNEGSCKKESISDVNMLDEMYGGHWDWDGDWDCDPRGELSGQAFRLWEKVKRTLTDTMIDKGEATRISQNTGFSFIDLFGMVYGVRVPNEKELLRLCATLIME